MPVAENAMAGWNIASQQGGTDGSLSPSLPPSTAATTPPRPSSPGLDCDVPPAVMALRNSMRNNKATRFSASKKVLEVRKSPVSRLKQRLLVADHHRASAHRMEAELLSQRLNKSMKM